MSITNKILVLLLLPAGLVASSSSYNHVPLENPILNRLQYSIEDDGLNHSESELLEMALPGEYQFWLVMGQLQAGSLSKGKTTSGLLAAGKDGFGQAYATLASFHNSTDSGFGYSESKARRYYKLAADLGDGPSMVTLGEFLFNDGGEKNFKEAKELLLKVINGQATFYEGPPDQAFFRLGMESNQIPTTESEPIVSAIFSQKHFSLAFAHLYLGLMALDADQYEAAIQSFENAIDPQEIGNEGHPYAALQLAMIYGLGDGVSRDFDLSQKYLDAYTRLSQTRIEQNALRAAENNLVARIMYQRSGSSIVEDLSEEQSRMETLIATKLADEDSEFFDPDEAVRWYNIAISNDLLWAKRSLAELYAIEEYSTFAPEKSYHLFKEAHEEAKYSSSIGFNLAICYLKGFGVEPNPDEGMRLINQYKEIHLGARLLHDRIKSFDRPITLNELYELEESYADEGFPMALAILGNRFRFGVGVEQDEEKGVFLLEKADMKGDGLGALYLAEHHFYKESYGNEGQTLTYISASYERGCSHAIPRLVSLRTRSYKELFDSEVNKLNVFDRVDALSSDKEFRKNAAFYKEQIELLQRYLDINPTDGYANNLLGLSYSRYAGLDDSSISHKEKAELVNKAIRAFELATENDIPAGYYNLALLYYEGEILEQNYLIAKNKFEMAANEDHSASNFYLAEMYRYGHGVEVDHDQAVEYYSISGLYLSSGVRIILDSAETLVTYYTSGEHFPVILDRAEFWINILLEYSTNDYGYFYLDIEKDQRDILRAGLNWLGTQKLINGDGASAKNIFSMVSNRWSFDHIRGKANLKLAEILYTGAVNGSPNVSQGDFELSAYQKRPGFYPIAAIYHRAYGNTNRSIRYLRKGMQKGDAKSYFDYALCRWTGYGVPVDLELAMRLFKKSADMGSYEAMVTLAAASYFGYEGAPSLEKALEYAEKAEMQAYPFASEIAEMLRSKLDGPQSGFSFGEELAFRVSIP